MASRVIESVLDASPLKLAGIVVIAATVGLVTDHMNSDAFTGVILTTLGYGFGHAQGVRQAADTKE